MTKRIWLSKFRFHIRLGAIPLLIVGLIFLFYPEFFLRFFKELTINPLDHFLIRMIGMFLFYVYLTIEYMINNPNYHRDLAFIQAMLLLGVALLFILFVFVWKFSYYFLIVSLYSMIFAIYLIMFVSKNLLVRD